MQVLVFLGSKVANFGQEVLNPQVLICGCFRAVNPPRHQILRIDREGMIDRWCHIARQMTSFVPKCLLIPIDVYSIIAWTLLLKLQWHTRIYEETFHVDSSSNNVKYLKFCGRKVESTRNCNFGNYGEISDSNLETGRYTVQNLESPGLFELTALVFTVFY